VLGVPELGGDEDVLALEAGNTAVKGLLERARNLLLVAVDLGEIEMAVSGLEGFEYGRLNLTRLGLPCSKSQCATTVSALHWNNGITRDVRDGGTGIEGSFLSERHDCRLDRGTGVWWVLEKVWTF
jgi:hypothetical protein